MSFNILQLYYLTSIGIFSQYLLPFVSITDQQVNDVQGKSPCLFWKSHVKREHSNLTAGGAYTYCYYMCIFAFMQQG